MPSIAVISDTHARSLKGLPPELLKALAEADWVVHCGDYTGVAVVRELQTLSNGVIHPSWGGPPFGIERDIAREFDGVDIILFGHTHDICHKTIGNVIFFNPGQAYPDFGTPASLGIVTVGPEGIEVEVKTFE